MKVGPFIMATEPDADEYLEELLKRHEYRSVSKVERRAQEHIKDERLKHYFINIRPVAKVA